MAPLIVKFDPETGGGGGWDSGCNILHWPSCESGTSRPQDKWANS